jgi:predicted transcriptional regulator
MEIATIETRLAEIERTQAAILCRLDDLLSVKTIKDWYSVEEVAERVSRTPYQVREWLRTGRMIGTKRPVGRGRQKEWEVSHEELTQYLSHGLRPIIRVAS